MDRSNVNLEYQLPEVVSQPAEATTLLSDVQLALVGGGIGDTTL